MSAPFGRLSVRDNQLVRVRDGVAEPVRLKGWNRSGLQHRPSLREAGMSDPDAELRAWREGWNAGIVRVPLSQRQVMTSAAYRDDVDSLVAAAARNGLFVILELHGLAEDLSAPLPTEETGAAWSLLARRYGAALHVVFDLWNEPHGVAWPAWRRIAERLIARIRNDGAGDTLVLVGGVDWAYDLAALTRPRHRIKGLGPVAYATHPYPGKGTPPHRRDAWQHHFGDAAADVCVLVTEFGADASHATPHGLGHAPAAADWLTELLAYVDELGLTALAWSAGDAPHLVHAHDGAPVTLPGSPPDALQLTHPFGSLVQAWMLAPPRR